MGTSVLTTQGVLQQQRDLMIERGAISIFNIGKKPPVFKGKQRMLLELRKGVKSGKPSDFFVAADSKSGQGKPQPAKNYRLLHTFDHFLIFSSSPLCTASGEVSGWVEIAAGLEEDVKRLYGPTPYECPPRPPDSFDPSALINHGSRIWDFILEIGELFGAYTYLVR